MGDAGLLRSPIGGCRCQIRFGRAQHHQGLEGLALNILGKGQESIAFTFFKSLERDGDQIGGQPFRSGKTGAPILENLPTFVECALVGSVEKGDHSVFAGEVVEAGLRGEIQGRPDLATL